MVYIFSFAQRHYGRQFDVVSCCCRAARQFAAVCTVCLASSILRDYGTRDCQIGFGRVQRDDILRTRRCSRVDCLRVEVDVSVRNLYSLKLRRSLLAIPAAARRLNDQPDVFTEHASSFSWGLLCFPFAL